MVDPVVGNNIGLKRKVFFDDAALPCLLVRERKS